MTLPDEVAAARCWRRCALPRASCSTDVRRVRRLHRPAGGRGQALAGPRARLPRPRPHAHRRGRRAACASGSSPRSELGGELRGESSSRRVAPSARLGRRLCRLARACSSPAPPASPGRWPRICSGAIPRFELVGVTGRSEAGQAAGRPLPALPRAAGDRAARPRAARADRRRDRRLPARRRGAHRGRAARARRARRRPQRRLPPRATSPPTSSGTATHPRPDLLGEAVYGLTELHRERIAAAPASWPTPAAIRRPPCSALAPLARAGLIADLVIDAKQGLSGAGRTFDETTHLSMAARTSFPTRSPPTATPRRSRSSLVICDPGQPIVPRCSSRPHLVPLDQGELASCYVTPTRPVEQDELDELYRERLRR